MICRTEPFAYDALDAETRIVVRQKTDEIRDRTRRAAQDIVEIGERLLSVKGHLGHGRFGRWLESEFQWSESAALKMMQVAEAFKSVNFTDLAIAPSALYALASPSTPEEVRAGVLAEAAAGREISHAEARRRIDASRPAGQPESPVVRTIASEIGAEDGDGAGSATTPPRSAERSVPMETDPAARRDGVTRRLRVSLDLDNPAASAADLAGQLDAEYLGVLSTELSAIVARARAAFERGIARPRRK